MLKVASVAVVHPCHDDMQSLQRGSYVKLVTKPFKGHLACITAVEGAADAASIGSSFMLESSLHKYHAQSEQRAGRMTHCWHVCYLLAVSMSAESASSSCERIGSHLHALEAGESNISPARVADKLRLRTAHVECIGSQRDENLIGSLVDMLRSHKLDPCIQRAAQSKRRQQGKAATGNLSVAQRVRMSNMKADCSCLTWAMLTELDEEEDDGMAMDSLSRLYQHRASEMQRHHDIHAPSSLGSATRQALQRVITHRADGLRIEALTGHVVRKKLPKSSMRQKMADWLASEGAEAWKQQRDALPLVMTFKISLIVIHSTILSRPKLRTHGMAVARWKSLHDDELARESRRGVADPDFGAAEMTSE